MEGLAPPLKCLIEMQASLQNGETARTGALRYVQTASSADPFAPEVRRLLFAWDQGREWRDVISKVKSAHRRALMDLLVSALGGQPILGHLEELRTEIINATDLEIRDHIEMLPVKMLIPLLLFQFPAFLVLLFGPLLTRLVEELNK